MRCGASAPAPIISSRVALSVRHVARREAGGAGGAPLGEHGAVEQRQRLPGAAVEQHVLAVHRGQGALGVVGEDRDQLDAEMAAGPGRHQQQRARRQVMMMAHRHLAAGRGTRLEAIDQREVVEGCIDLLGRKDPHPLKGSGATSALCRSIARCSRGARPVDAAGGAGLASRAPRAGRRSRAPTAGSRDDGRARGDDDAGPPTSRARARPARRAAARPHQQVERQDDHVRYRPQREFRAACCSPRSARRSGGRPGRGRATGSSFGAQHGTARCCPASGIKS